MDLALTGSLGPFSVALRQRDGTTLPTVTEPGRPDLTALVAKACHQADARPEDIRSVRLDLGPGSYTGLRVAVTFANMCRDIGPCQILTVTTFELIAAAARPLTQQPPEGSPPFAIRFDARRGRWHCGDVDVDAESITMASPPRAIPIAQAQAELADLPAGAEFLGDPAVVRTLADSPTSIQPIPDVDARHLFDPRLRWTDARADVQPLYLMGSYAEEP